MVKNYIWKTYSKKKSKSLHAVLRQETLDSRQEDKEHLAAYFIC